MKRRQAKLLIPLLTNIPMFRLLSIISTAFYLASGLHALTLPAKRVTTSAWDFDDSGHANITFNLAYEGTEVDINPTAVQTRSFYVHIPPSYDSSVEYPLVFSFHGYGDNDTFQEYISGFSDSNITINNKPIIAVYPDAAPGLGKTGNEWKRAWQGAPYSPANVDDITFIHVMVQALIENLSIDTKRIYASGKSNGGGFVNLLACTPSTAALFAAFAPVSPALYNGTLGLDLANQCDVTGDRALPIIHFHGLNDTTAPYAGRTDLNGNTSYALPSITQWRQDWAGFNTPSDDSAALTAIVTEPLPETTEYAWEYGPFDGYSVNNLGHSWPDIDGADGGVTPYNATQTSIIPFFNQHVLP